MDMDYGSAQWQMLNQQTGESSPFTGPAGAMKKDLPTLAFDPISPTSNAFFISPQAEGTHGMQAPLFGNVPDHSIFSTRHFRSNSIFGLSPPGSEFGGFFPHQWPHDENVEGRELMATEGSPMFAPHDLDTGSFGGDAAASAAVTAAQKLVDQHHAISQIREAQRKTSMVDLIPEINVKVDSLDKLTKAERKKIRENTRNLNCFNWLYHKQYGFHRPATIRQKTSSAVELSIVSTANGTDYAVVMPSAAALRKDGGQATVKVVSIGSLTKGRKRKLSVPHHVRSPADEGTTQVKSEDIADTSCEGRREDEEVREGSPPYEHEVDLGQFQTQLQSMGKGDVRRLLGSMESQIAVLREYISSNE
ncbi:uncharacterized protein EV422DRAFT_569862 [Fimicolochytrium jonesii]|uniref:uncharacterized protein n=1 Tax=Fimicolochytrium jonesii TaxID=1396493 RepID=UPI0022FE7E4A|nr:uncharacterized protein EV422DRAFT_569862 [Fimicolochytrium jonesii]KAI8818441.1 hypothetical protein EV422DRAFT_569862 [Fimicolochytrium jonesii]